MPSPQNYIRNVNNPVEALQRGFQQGTAIRRQPELEAREQSNFDRQLQLQGREDVLFDQQQQDRERGLAEVENQKNIAQEFQSDMQYLAQNPTAENYSTLIAKHPKSLAPIKEAYDSLDERNKKTQERDILELHSVVSSGDFALADSMLSNRQRALENSGDAQGAQVVGSMRKMLEFNPKGVLNSLRIQGEVINSGMFGDKQAKAGIQSTQNFQNGTIQKIFKDGSVEVQDPDGKTVTGIDARRVLEEANQFETQVTTDRAGGRKQATTDVELATVAELAARKESGSQSTKLSLKQFENAANINKSITSIDRAISAIDKGAKSGFIYKKFPSLTESSAELESALNQLGLDVVSMTTFGALSEGELRLAMNTAAPRNLDSADLKNWLVRHRAAKVKLMDELNDSAAFLAKPENTLSDLLEQRVNLKGDSQQSGQVSSAMQSLIDSFGGN